MRKFCMIYFMSLSVCANLAAWFFYLDEELETRYVFLFDASQFLGNNLEFFFPLQLLYPIGLTLYRLGVSLSEWLYISLAILSVPLCYLTARSVSFFCARWSPLLVVAGYGVISFVAHKLLYLAVFG